MNASNTGDTTVEFVKGSWQDHLATSTTLLTRAGNARKRASALLWQGAQEGIETWLPNSDDDANGEGLYGEVLEALGTPRKGDASKIKTVALAVKQHNLVLATFPNLSKAYAEATRLTKTVAQEKDEDDAAEKAIANIEAPKTTGSIEGAAALLLSKGVDGAVVAILDALGAKNEAAHRAFLRAVSTEIAARVQANKPAPVKKASGPKAGAQQATGETTTKPKATVKEGKAKAKATPVSASKGDPNKKALPPKAKPVTKAKPAPVTEDSAPVEEPVEDETLDLSTTEVDEENGVTDLDDEAEVEQVTIPAPKAKRRAVVRR